MHRDMANASHAVTSLTENSFWSPIIPTERPFCATNWCATPDKTVRPLREMSYREELIAKRAPYSSQAGRRWCYCSIESRWTVLTAAQEVGPYFRDPLKQPKEASLAYFECVSGLHFVHDQQGH